MQVPVEQLEAAVIRHDTSRAGDPHRHLRLQINARVFAQARWRGLHSVGARDYLEAINGIGHAAVATDLDFRLALAEHGLTLDPASGEPVELASYAPSFSARAAQIGRNLDTFEAAWRADHPGEEPGPRLRQAWDRRAGRRPVRTRWCPPTGRRWSRRGTRSSVGSATATPPHRYQWRCRSRPRRSAPWTGTGPWSWCCRD